MWKRGRSTDKRYPGDNRLIFPKSPYRRDGLAPRCRLVASWGRSRSQGLGCSPIKAARELGLERRSLRLPGVIRGCPPAHIGGTLCREPNGDKGNTEGSSMQIPKLRWQLEYGRTEPRNDFLERLRRGDELPAAA